MIIIQNPKPNSSEVHEKKTHPLHAILIRPSPEDLVQHHPQHVSFLASCLQINAVAGERSTVPLSVIQS